MYLNNVQSTYKPSLMRTNATMYGREDLNIEDIHCQIVMRVQKSKQLLRELEGGDELYGSVGHLSDGEGVEKNLFAPTGHSSKHNVIA